ncbi:MAG: hypothetical protein LLG05_12560 [Porphyromonadaceae bacterium]|nr:hypothetical protein [Porphyromonadaceae bacterium]
MFGSATTSKIGFYGLATPIVQPTKATAVATTEAVTTGVTCYGYSTSTQANAIVTAVNATIANLTALGLTS